MIVREINLGPRARRNRSVLGGILLAAGLGVGLILTGAPWPWRLGLYLPFWMGALGLFQAREKT